MCEPGEIADLTLGIEGEAELLPENEPDEPTLVNDEIL